MSMIKNAQFKYIIKTIKRRTYSNIYFFLVKKDVTTVDYSKAPKARIDIKLREYQNSDYEYFKNDALGNKLIEAKIPTCLVAVTNNNIPCFRCWFLEPANHKKVQSFFGYNYPELKEDEFMLELVHTVKEYRSQYVYVAANFMLMKKAKDLGYKWVIGCISLDNLPSLKGANRAGGHPYKLQITKWRFFRRKTIYVDIPEKIKAKYPQLSFPY